MTITSYPPVSMSQASGGQVPIKVLIPIGQANKKTQSSSSTEKQEMSMSIIKQEEDLGYSPLGSPAPFFSDSPGPSITIDANPDLKMPIQTTLTHQTRSRKNLNFLVN